MIAISDAFTRKNLGDEVVEDEIVIDSLQEQTEEILKFFQVFVKHIDFVDGDIDQYTSTHESSRYSLIFFDGRCSYHRSLNVCQIVSFDSVEFFFPQNFGEIILEIELFVARVRDDVFRVSWNESLVRDNAFIIEFFLHSAHVYVDEVRLFIFGFESFFKY